MRWLALKDLQILRRSPLVVGILLAYSLGLGLVVGPAADKGPSKPRVAVVNEIPENASTFNLGNEQIDANRYAEELFESIEPIRVDSREEAIELVRAGDALGALVVPSDITTRLQSTINLAGGEPPTVEFYYEGDDPLKSRYVQSALKARISDANRALSQRITEVAAEYIGFILRGGEFSLLGESFDVLGLVNAERIVEEVAASLPAAREAERAALARVAEFADLAAENLDLSNDLLGTIGTPIQVDSTELGGRSGSINSYLFATALAISLMFVCALLAAGLLALEREEHAFGRLVRGLVSRTAIVVEKTLLAALLGAVAAGLTLALLVVFGYGVDAARLPAALAVVVLGAAAFAALGVALGALAREVRAASLLAVLVLLPVAVLGLIPAGTVSSGAYDAIRTVSAAFPFRPTLRGIDAGLAQGAIGGFLVHLAILLLAYGTLARVALRRFG